MIGALTAVSLLLTTASRQGPEFGIALGRGVGPVLVNPIYYYPEFSAETVFPAAVLLGAELPLGQAAYLGVRAGYTQAGVSWQSGRDSATFSSATTVNGFQTQVVLAATAAATGVASLRAGLALGYCGANTTVLDNDAHQSRTLDGTTSGLVQSALAGIRLRLGRRFSLGVEGEMTGVVCMAARFAERDSSGRVVRRYGTNFTPTPWRPAVGGTAWLLWSP
jgi:hypothetical protein